MRKTSKAWKLRSSTYSRNGRGNQLLGQYLDTHITRWGHDDVPAVDLIEDMVSLSLGVSCEVYVLHNPLDEVVLKCPLDQLVE